MDDKQKSKSGTSEKPGEFIESFFRRGAQFASDLIAEMEELKRKVDRLNRENLELRHQLASDDAIRDLLKKIESLESEKEKLGTHFESEIKKQEDFAGKYSEVEKELDTMANLYVASFQLHATLDNQEVLGTIEQLLAQFIGAASFTVYLRDIEDGKSILRPVHCYHCSAALGSKIDWNEGPIGETAANQLHFVADPQTLDEGDPLACIPMVLSDQTIGVIAIFELFEQKEKFVDIDFELFKLLAFHSASAIVGAGLMARAKDVNQSLKTYQHL